MQDTVLHTVELQTQIWK